MLKHLCPRCNKNVISYTDKYCPECSKNIKIDKAESNRLYDKNVRKNVNVYASKIWHRVRKQALARDNGLCLCCLNNGGTEYADLVHHIDTVEDNKDRMYDVYNLISVCRCCHDLIHDEYKESSESKKNKQNELFKLIK